MKVRHSIILEEDNYVAASAMYKLRNFRNVSELVNRALEEYLASQFQDRIELLAKIHEQSEREVRITNGLLNFKTALEQLNGNKQGADEWEMPE